VSRALKDSTNKKRTLELVKRDDGAFDLFANQTLDRSAIQEQWLPEELCVRFGLCSEEYRSILCDVQRNGRTTRLF